MTQEKKHSETGQDCPEGYKSCDGYKIPKEWHIVRFDSLFSKEKRREQPECAYNLGAAGTDKPN